MELVDTAADDNGGEIVIEDNVAYEQVHLTNNNSLFCKPTIRDTSFTLTWREQATGPPLVGINEPRPNFHLLSESSIGPVIVQCLLVGICNKPLLCMMISASIRT